MYRSGARRVVGAAASLSTADKGEVLADGGPLYRDARGQLNAQISYRLPGSWDHFTLLLWGVNLTKAITSETALFPTGPTVRVGDSDRRVSIGLRARW